MDKVFDNVKAYDFFGIWGAGIITLMYGIVSYAVIFQNNIFLFFRDFQADYSLLLIFCLSVMAYFIGTLIHEVGKWIYGAVLQPDTLIALAVKEDVFLFFKHQKKVLFSYVQTYYGHILDENGTPTQFSEMIEYLKAKGQSKVIDRYHALYGLMRGLLVGIFLVFGMSVFMLILHGTVYCICLVITDIVIFWILLIRTYRYYISWIGHTIAQYSLHKYKI